MSRFRGYVIVLPGRVAEPPGSPARHASRAASAAALDPSARDAAACALATSDAAASRQRRDTPQSRGGA